MAQYKKVITDSTGNLDTTDRGGEFWAVDTGGGGGSGTVTSVSVVTLFTPIGAGAVPYRITGTTPAVQTTAAQRGLTDRGLTVTATGDANGAVGDLVGVHYVAEAEFIT